MSKVYFKPLVETVDKNHASEFARELLEKLIAEEKIHLEKKVPLKVHFGEKDNSTFVKSENYLGIINYLKENSVETCFIETNVLYGGKRNTKKKHLITAEEHGFNQLPIEIADGEVGQDYYEVEIDGKQFKKCLIASGFRDYKQMIVLAHFKGHMMAGFGGAIKQLAMGCASRGGKMAQHLSAKPFIIPFLCRKCGACKRVCAVDAIKIGRWSKIDKNKCVGCAACTGVCNFHAIHTNYFRFLLLDSFTEKLAEYSYAAQLGKKNIYVNFAMNITSGCDCEGRKMTPLIPDVGVFASTDPVAIDQACLDMVDKIADKVVFKKGREALDIACKMGMGSREYELVTL